MLSLRGHTKTCSFAPSFPSLSLIAARIANPVGPQNPMHSDRIRPRIILVDIKMDHDS
jgi:hypothetical protein